MPILMPQEFHGNDNGNASVAVTCNTVRYNSQKGTRNHGRNSIIRAGTVCTLLKEKPSSHCTRAPHLAFYKNHIIHACPPQFVISFYPIPTYLNHNGRQSSLCNHDSPA